MAYTIADAQTRLAYRLGESTAPTVTAETNKRLSWFVEALQVILRKRPFWFTQTIATDATVANQPNYPWPSDFRKEIQVYVNGYKYEKITPDEIDNYRNYLEPVQVLSSQAKYLYYTLGGYFYLIPTPTAVPTAKSVTTLVSSGTTATATVTDHGWVTNDYVTIAGASPSAYNGNFQITKVDDDTFTYTLASDPADTTTGTITATKDNIEIWHYKTPTMPSSSSSGIVVPDEFINALVSYAEGRYWSSAHTRGKSSDAFAEFETIVKEMEKEDFRRSFNTGMFNYERSLSSWLPPR